MKRYFIVVVLALLAVSTFTWLVSKDALVPAEAQTTGQVDLRPDFLKAVPNAIKVKSSTVVTITAQIPVVGTLIPASVNLVRYDDQGNIAEILGKMYDDGTHGDTLLGDNTFTAQFTPNQLEPSVLTLRVSVAYRGMLQRFISEPLLVFVQADESPTQVLSELGDKIVDGRIEEALTRFSQSPRHREALFGLTGAQKTQLATAFKAAKVIKMKDNVAVLSMPWLEENGTSSQVKISLARDILGRWNVMSW